VSRSQTVVYACLLVVSAAASAGAERGSSRPVDSARVIVSGARRFSEERVRTWALGRDGLRRIAQEYAEAGYWSAAISDSTGYSADGDSVRWITIREGPPATLASGQFPANLSGPADVPDWMRRILRRQAEAGHPFAHVALASAREPEDGHFVLEPALEPGLLVRVARVRPFGNTVTRAEVLARELRLRPDAPYDERQVQRWRRRLVRTGYFEDVGEPSVVWHDSSAGQADLVISVVEGKPNRFEGVVGYQPGTAGESGQFAGLVNLTLGNLWGTGRLLDVRWNHPLPATTTLDLAYREPWVAGYPVDAEGRLAIEQRVGYALERIELALGGEIIPDLSASGSLGREIVRSDSIVLLGGPRYRGITLRGVVDYDTRDEPLNPSRGLRYHLDWLYAFRRNRVNDPDFIRYYGESDTTGEGAWPSRERTSTVRVDLEHYFPLGRVFVLALGWHGAQVTSDKDSTGFSAADQVRLGGALTLRGYRQEQFLGDRAVWGNHELRYRVGTSSRLFAFLDAGTVRARRFDPQTQEMVTTTAWPVGYGVGLRARTGAGLIGVDFGWGRQDSFGQGKVHVRLETVF